MTDSGVGFSIAFLQVRDLAIRVRYRRHCHGSTSFGGMASEGDQSSSVEDSIHQERQPPLAIESTLSRIPSRVPNQDMCKTCQESRPKGPNRLSPWPTVTTPSTLSADMCHSTGGLETVRKREGRGGGNNNERSSDETGFLVWPGSRVLASFLVDPLGVRHQFPQAVGGRGIPSHSGRHFDNCWCSSSSCTHVAESLPAVDCHHINKVSQQRCAEQIPLLRAIRRTASPPKTAVVLELGAGTGVCGMAASLSLGCRVIMTDRRSDILANLRENIKLNGLQGRARVVQLEWESETCEERDFPPEIRRHSPFKMILASDTVYPGKPFSEAKAFFSTVSRLLEPERGVLLLTYTPRPPSIYTENMLRCAHRAGLKGHALASEDGQPTAVSSPYPETKPRKLRPVLLSFGLSKDEITRSAIPNTNHSRELYGRPARDSESACLSKWESVFPEIRHRKLRAVSEINEGSPHTWALDGRSFQDHQNKEELPIVNRDNVWEKTQEDDTVTAEFLWGSPPSDWGT